MTLDYAKIRLITGPLNQTQVQSIEAIQHAWEKYGDGSAQKLAYVLATAWHECEFTPVSENLTYTSAQRIHDVWPSRFPTTKDALPYVKNAQKLANKVYGGRLGNTDPNDGWDYRGRGLCQITGKGMYDKVGKLIGVDLVANPDFAKQNDTSAKIIVIGMVKGLFTGKKMDDYFPANGTLNPTGARAIINGDVAANGARVAGYARQFKDALSIPIIANAKPAPQQTFDGGGNEGVIGTPQPETVTVNIPTGNAMISVPPPKSTTSRSIAVIIALATAAGTALAYHFGVK